MSVPHVTTVDFETMPIRGRPDYPPEPVGVSIKKHKQKGKYFAWGHPTGGNNCSKKDGIRALKSVWKDEMVFHNAKFDVAVACEKLGLPMPSWDKMHDTMFLLFLHDPHERQLELKPAAEKLLGMAPDERDAVKEWLLEHKAMLAKEYGLKFTAADKGPNTWAQFIGYAPGDLVGKYANGDTKRTVKLFKWLYKDIEYRGMLPAYNRERQCMPIFMENERLGMRVDLKSLNRDIEMYDEAKEKADRWLRKKLKADISLDSDRDVAKALSEAGIIDDDKWTLTPTGQRSVAKKNLKPDMYNDPQIAAAFGYRNRLSTCLKFFMYPWQEQAAQRGGIISTNWNQVRNAEKGMGGTRTGRPSTSNPNFLNISKTWYDKNDDYEHPTKIKLPELPAVRQYILPDKGGRICHRDFDGQELRIMAHFEDGPLMSEYTANSRLDVHDHVRQLIEDITGLIYFRGQVKITNFRRIYGGGAPATAGALNVDIATAKELLAAHAKALPGLKDLNKAIKEISQAGDPLVTWGGREYYVEEPKFDKRFNRPMTYEYKLLNYIVQGSAADATKQALINYHNHPKRRGRFMVTVYDEINSTVDKKGVKEEMAVLRDSMECLKFDVPLLSDGKIGKNWAALKPFKEGKSKYE